MSCIPFSSKKFEWLPGKQISPCPIFQATGWSSERVSSRMCQKHKISFHSISATQTQCLGISCESVSFSVHLTELFCSLSLSEQDCPGKEGLQLLGPLAERSWRKCCQTQAGIDLHSLSLMQMFTGECWDGLSSVLMAEWRFGDYRSNWAVVSPGRWKVAFSSNPTGWTNPRASPYPTSSSEKLIHSLRGLPACVHWVAALLLICCHWPHCKLLSRWNQWDEW